MQQQLEALATNFVQYYSTFMRMYNVDTHSAVDYAEFDEIYNTLALAALAEAGYTEDELEDFNYYTEQACRDL